jgi:beta-lactamase regulating signal transducer with metallopeptidase domain
VSALLDHLWQSTLFGGVVWSITLCLRKNAAAVRHGLWLVASLKFLVPFSALYLLGAAAGIPAPVDSRPEFFPAMLDVAAPALSSGLTPGPVPRTDYSWAPVLAVVLWLAGSSWMACQWWRGWHRAHALTRDARPAPLGMRGVLLTHAGVEPSVARVFRPVVMLPATLLERLQPGRLQAVLAHEREHIARHDLLKAQLHRLVEVLFWFHPLVWFIGRRLVEERERACDEAVLAGGHEPGEYVAGILEVCRHCVATRDPHTVSALAGDLPRRVARILEARSPASLGFLKSFALSLAAFGVAVMPLFAGTVDHAAQQRERVERDMRVLLAAQLEVRNAAPGGGPRLHASDTALDIRDSSLRELLALAYGVAPEDIGGRDWLDHPRYDIRAVWSGSRIDADDFDPTALRAMVTRLLATRFNLEIHVNHHCQHPCGPRALASPTR